MTTKEMIAVMQAYDNGADIEYHANGKWHPAPTPIWDWSRLNYRVKPEGKK